MDNRARDIRDLFLTFFKIGAFTFGGGYAMIPIIQNAVVDEKGWITKEEMVDIVAIAEMTPGPIAINSATFIGYKVSGFIGACMAVLGVVLPSFLVITVIASVFTRFQELPAIKAAFKGIRATIVALIAVAAVRMGKGAIKDRIGLIITIVSLLLLLFLDLNAIYIIILGAIAGLFISHIQKNERKTSK